MTLFRNPPGVRPRPRTDEAVPPQGGSGVPPVSRWQGFAATAFLHASDDLAEAAARYFRAVDGEGDPRAIREAVDNLRAAHRNYERAKEGQL